MPRVERFAILSHTLPPSPSVHAMVLRRLLEGVPEGRYCLIRSGKGDAGEAARALPDLPAVRYELRQAYSQKILYRFNWILPSVVVNALFAIGSRAFQVARILKKERCDLLIACTGDLHDLPAACLAARWADEWNVWGTPELLAHKSAVLERHCEAVGGGAGPEARAWRSATSAASR